jgi:hypothetical protein
MPNREEIHVCIEKLLVATATATDATPVASAALDTQGFDSAHFTLAIGATLGTGSGAMTYKVTESDDNSTYTDAAAASVVDDGGALAANTAKRVAYIGAKRYAKLVVTPKANDIYTVLGHLGYPSVKPPANPA